MAYSKKQIDKAGKFFAGEIRAAFAGQRKLGQDRAEIEAAIDAIEWWRSQHSKPLSRVASNLNSYVAELGEPVVAQRVKRVPTIAGKLLREPTMKLSRMEDVGGVRAVLPHQDAAYRVAGSLKRNWTITRFRDYVAEPKADGYRALHLINRNRGRLIEIQLRTPRQDEWANAVEGASRRFPGLKFGEGPPVLRQFFEASARFYAMLDGSLELDMSLVGELEALAVSADTLTVELTDES